MLANFHTHTTFCDGKNTPEEIVLYSIENGFDAIGFSGHGFTPYDLRYCMKDTLGYIKEIKRLKEKYKDKITVLLGCEYDLLSDNDLSKFEYVIGSCHSIIKDGKYLSVDHSEQTFYLMLLPACVQVL